MRSYGCYKVNQIANSKEGLGHFIDINQTKKNKVEYKKEDYEWFVCCVLCRTWV